MVSLYLYTFTMWGKGGRGEGGVGGFLEALKFVDEFSLSATEQDNFQSTISDNKTV